MPPPLILSEAHAFEFECRGPQKGKVRGSGCLEASRRWQPICSGHSRGNAQDCKPCHLDDTSAQLLTHMTGYSYRFWEFTNTLRFGVRCPRKFQRIFVRPGDVQYNLLSAEFKKAHGYTLKSSRNPVNDKDWSPFVEPLDRSPRIERVKWKVTSGLSWKDVGEYALMMRKIESRGRADGCSGLEDLHHRYAVLDDLIESCRQTGTLKDQSELGGSFREKRALMSQSMTRHG